MTTRQQHYFTERAEGHAKRARTRAALLDGAISVVARHGLESTTIQAVTRATGVAHGTFYNHFDDREDLLVSAAIAVLDEINVGVQAAAQRFPPGVDRLVIAAAKTIMEAVSIREFGHLLVAAVGRFPQVTDRIRPKLRADLRAALAAGVVRVAPTRLLDEQIGALLGLAIQRVLSGGQVSRITRETAHAILRLLGQTPDEAAETVARVFKVMS
ncbi:MAG: TetR/AcrR family transcriptional regulator [Pseudomonadota bacterium]